MKNKLLVGLWQDMVELPPAVWEEQVSERLAKFKNEHKFMTEEHRLVHHFIVKELPKAGKPLSTASVATNTVKGSAYFRSLGYATS